MFCWVPETDFVSTCGINTVGRNLSREPPEPTEAGLHPASTLLGVSSLLLSTLLQCKKGKRPLSLRTSYTLELPTDSTNKGKAEYMTHQGSEVALVSGQPSRTDQAYRRDRDEDVPGPRPAVSTRRHRRPRKKEGRNKAIVTKRPLWKCSLTR